MWSKNSPAAARSDPPQLLPGADEWLEAFWELCTDRPIGMSAGPIPAASIDRWIDRNGYSGQDATGFRRCIRAMDGTFMGWRKDPLSNDGIRALLSTVAKGEQK